MPVSGDFFVGYARTRTGDVFHAVDPSTGATLEPAFSAASAEHVQRACALAEQAFEPYRRLDAHVRAQFLESVAERIMALGDELLERASMESGLPVARLTGERARTVGQLRLFADELRIGGWMGLRVDRALPERKPLPRPDLRQRSVPLGPAVVFGASNFPLAFSVAGGDTASALAAGCPVIAKGHPAHPGTGELVAQAIVDAAVACNMPEGVFSLLNGPANDLGAGLVADPRVKAVGFTGSRAGGLALMRIANARPEPIPVYAEMSSINPVVLLPGALAARADTLARDFVGSMTLGAGQFCTNPGLVVAIEGAALDRFIACATAALGQVAPAVMLTPGIHTAFEKGVERLTGHAHVTVLARGAEGGRHCGRPALFAVDAAGLFEHPDLAQEVFGASSIIVRCASEEEIVRVLDTLEGQLTASLHLEPRDESFVARLVPVLERKVGRLIANGWPTGVEVSHAMVHGGPFPATSDGRSTSVGTRAIERWLRPVCYQDFPDSLLQKELRRSGGLALPHRLDGAYLNGSG